MVYDIVLTTLITVFPWNKPSSEKKWGTTMNGKPQDHFQRSQLAWKPPAPHFWLMVSPWEYSRQQSSSYFYPFLGLGFFQTIRKDHQAVFPLKIGLVKSRKGWTHLPSTIFPPPNRDPRVKYVKPEGSASLEPAALGTIGTIGTIGTKNHWCLVAHLWFC